MSERTPEPGENLPWQLRLRGKLGGAGPGGAPKSALPSRFRELGELGRGAMGRVVRAQDSASGREVAIKLLPGGGSLKLRERLVREAQALGKVSHPNVVKVHELLHHQGAWLLVMDYAEGQTLEAAMEAGPLPVAQAVELALGLVAGLSALHRQGIVHRDVKPPNVLISPSGQPLLLDLGVSKLLDETQPLSRTGDTVGTPSYMAPEQVSDAKHVDARADLYGLGATLYHMLTGSPPIAGNSLQELLVRVALTTPQPPHRLNRKVDDFLSAVCLRCLAKLPQERYPDAEALGAALRRHQAGQRGVGRLPKPWLLALLVVLALALGGGLAALTRRSPAPRAGPDPALLDREARALLERSAPLLEDAAAIEALRERWERLEGEGPDRAAGRVQTLVGLLALARSEPARAEEALRRVQELGSSPAGRALEAAVQSDPLGLTRAIAGGIARPELRAWRVEARLEEGLTRATAQEVLDDLEALAAQRPLSAAQQEHRVQALLRLPDLTAAEGALAQLGSASPELRWSVALAGLDLKDPAGALQTLAALPAAGPSEARRIAARTCLELCAAVRSEAGLDRLGPAQVEREWLYLRLRNMLDPSEEIPEPLLLELRGQIGTLNFSKDRLGLALTLADALPERADVQLDVSLLTSLVHAHQRDRLEPAMRRALRLEVDPARKRDVGLRLAASLCGEPGSREEATEAVALCDRFLPGCDGPVERHYFLLVRGHARQLLGQWSEALEDYDAAIAAHDGVQDAYGARGHLLRQLGQPERALQDLARCLELDERDQQEEELAAMWELARKHGWEARARSAFELEMQQIPERTGWWIRLAWLQLRLGDEQAASTSLGQAPPFDDELAEALGPRLAQLQRSLDPSGLDSLVEELERLRGEGTGP